MIRTIVLRTALSLLALLLASEAAHTVAAHQNTGGSAAGACTVFVLGYPTNDDGTASSVEVERMEAAAAALKLHQCGRIVISGGAAHNGFVEADVMAGLAGELGVAREKLLLERQARDTKENVALSLPLIADGDTVFIVSNALHAQRGRRYFCAARPAECGRTYIAPTARPWSRLPQRLAESVHEALVFLRDSVG